MTLRMVRRIIVCGSRTWPSEWILGFQLDKMHQWPHIRLAEKPDLVIITGGAKGTDRMADAWGKRNGCQLAVYPAQWSRYGAAAGPMRNQEMLDVCHPDLVLAFRVSGISRGTDDMVRRARKAGVLTMQCTLMPTAVAHVSNVAWHTWLEPEAAQPEFEQEYEMKWRPYGRRPAGLPTGEGGP